MISFLLLGRTVQDWWRGTDEKDQEEPRGPVEGIDVGQQVQVSGRVLDEEGVVDLSDGLGKRNDHAPIQSYCEVCHSCNFSSKKVLFYSVFVFGVVSTRFNVFMMCFRNTTMTKK